jgi:hypothetical protein
MKRRDNTMIKSKKMLKLNTKMKDTNPNKKDNGMKSNLILSKLKKYLMSFASIPWPKTENMMKNKLRSL